MRFLWHLVRWLVRLVAFAGVVGFCGIAYDVVSSKLDARKFPPPGQLVDVGGRNMHLYCTGESKGTPTVILEATGVGSVLQYAKVQPELAARTRVCSYDRAGMGWSDPTGQAHTAQNAVDDLDRLLSKAGVSGPYIFVAGSAGGLSAELYARQHPSTVVGLVMLDALAGSVVEAMPEAGAKLEKRACMARVAAHFGVLRVMDPFKLRKLLSKDRDATIAWTYRGSTWDAVCGQMQARDESAAQIKQSPPLRADLPLVVIRHEKPTDVTGDPASDAALEPKWQVAMEKIAAASSKGSVVVADGAGHLIADDRSDLVVATLLKMIGTPAPQPAKPVAAPVKPQKHHSSKDKHGKDVEDKPEAAEPAPAAPPPEAKPEPKPEAKPDPPAKPRKPHVDEDE
jgi:pimeloyl-ACP methyl ester carboxylesterase